MDYFRQLAAAGGVFLLLGCLLWWMRRRGFAAPGRTRARRIEVVERLALGPHHSLHLVRMDGAALLVACSPSGCSLIETAGARRVSEAQL